MHAASRVGDVPLVKQLLKCGVDPTARDEKTWAMDSNPDPVMRNPPVINLCGRIVSGISEVTDRFCNPENEGNLGSRGVSRDLAGYRHGQSAHALRYLLNLLPGMSNALLACLYRLYPIPPLAPHVYQSVIPCLCC